MREIKFRGQRLHTEEWVYGYYNKALTPAKYGDILTQHRINLTGIENYFVIPETVGQYTGLKDKNGVEIYEGDILCDENKEIKQGKAVSIVKWSKYHACFIMERYNGEVKLFVPGCTNSKDVIGNIHSNPELLK